MINELNCGKCASYHALLAFDQRKKRNSMISPHPIFKVHSYPNSNPNI